ncbi:hypothetical protein LCGC14_0860670 [marine sediment metagenome]|uniref:Uncharacterized protein n=1 Tax=marine sediment metagenome TaxID=412755 RepID=A0A0F9PCI1_9ZZZZ
MKDWDFDKMMETHLVKCPVATEANEKVKRLCFMIRSLQMEVDHLRGTQSPSEQLVSRAINTARYLLDLYEKKGVRELLGSQLHFLLSEMLEIPTAENRADEEQTKT